MFEKMKLSQRISLGFSSILIIAVALGLVAILNMTKSGSNASTLAKEYVPSVVLASKLVTSGANIRINVRSYSLSELPIYFDNYSKEKEIFNKLLEEMDSLANTVKSIPELKDYTSTAKNSFAKYDSYTMDTKKINDKLDTLRTEMNADAKLFMDNAAVYLNSQNGKLSVDIDSKLATPALKERVSKINNANDIIDLGNAIRIANFKGQALRDMSLLEGVMGNFTKISELLDKLKLITKTEVDLNNIEMVRSAGEAYKNRMIEFQNNWKARLELDSVRNVAADDTLSAIDKISSLGLDDTSAIAESTNISLSASTIIMVIGLTIAVVLGASLSIIIISSISKAINHIVNSLKTGAEQVFQASEQLSFASQSLAEGSSEQAAAIEETSSTLDETSSMVQQNTENTKLASVLSNNAKESADKGNKEMEDMMKAMLEIKESSNQISKIIKVIDDIAFQTNILALNAAVEAAGAGEAGMGFAVVAEEVRNLAQRSAQAAKDTADMIETSIIRADRGAGIAEKVAHSLNEIREQSKKVNEIMNEITTASQEQAQGIFQISKAVNQMEQVTQSIASGAEESASSSEELSAQSESLMEIVTSLIILVDGEKGRNTSNIPVQHRSEGRSLSKPQQKSHKAIISKASKKGSSKEFSPENIIPLNENSMDF